MTKPTTRPQPAAGTGFPFAGFPLDALGKTNGQALDAWMRLNRSVMESIGRFQQETSRFVARRLEEDVARQQQIFGCRTPEEAWQVYAEFAQQAVRDYTEEAGRLSEIAAEVQQVCSSGLGETIAAAEAAQPAEPKPAAKSAA